MPATVTTLDREIAREERRVGLPIGEPLTEKAIARRQVQIAVVLAGCGMAALGAVFAASGVVRVLAVALAFAFGAYAIEKDRHLRRLALLRGDARRITLVVADELMCSGVLAGERELLDLRDGIGRAAGRLATALADLVAADCARVRLVGPSGEVPVAAERDLAPRRPVPDEDAPALEAVRVHKPVRTSTVDGRGVLAVPVWLGNEMVAVFEVVGAAGTRYMPRDATLVDGYARGAVAALLAPHV
jgi:hypothetical protein